MSSIAGIIVIILLISSLVIDIIAGIKAVKTTNKMREQVQRAKYIIDGFDRLLTEINERS
jgi:hypothetical protein